MASRHVAAGTAGPDHAAAIAATAHTVQAPTGQAGSVQTIAGQGGGTIRTAVAGDAIVRLPAGTDLGAIVASGRDLVVMLPDGTRLVIVDGAVFVPELVVGTVEVPPTTLVALLIGHEVQTAAGPPSSSGGNFAVPVGGLGDAYAIGDLLPPTELAFTIPVVQELDGLPRLGAVVPPADLEPSVTIITPQTPGGAANAAATVSEAGLPARGAETPGSNAASTLETTTGSVQYDPGDAPAQVTVDGIVVSAVGQAITTTYGVLTITAVRADGFDYSYTLTDNTSGNVSDVLNVVVTDVDGDTAPGTLTITIVDDVPTAIADVDRVAAPTGPAAASATVGVDFTDGSFLAGIPAGSTSVALNGATLSSINGALGFFQGATVLSPGDGAPGQGFTQEIDAYNDQPEGLQITFAQAQSTVRLMLGQLYQERLFSQTPEPERVTVTVTLADGTTATRTVAAVSQAQPGIAIVTLNAADFGGIAIRSVVLAPDPTLPPVPAGVVVPPGSAASAALPYSEFVLRGISYDVASTVPPTAPFADGNVLTGVGGTDANATDGVADVQGADGALVTGVVAGVATSAAGNLGTAVTGTYGTLTLSADGSYRYTPSAANAELRALIPGETRTDTFTYTITDGDGDTSSTTLTITIDGSNDPIVLTGLTPAITGGDVLVSEANLPGGTAPAPAALVQSGDFTVVAPDGYGIVTVAGQTVLTGGTFIATTITTPLGNTLAITAFDPATGTVSYQYTLNGPANSAGTASDRVTETFNVVATDRDGSSTSGSLVATIVDDAPVLNADIDSVAVGTPSGSQTSATVVDFTDTGLWTGIAAGSTQAGFGGVTLSSVNGTLSYFLGASVTSPSDGQPRQGWTAEVDAYNDLPEGLVLTFAQAQATVRVTVGQLYQEQLLRPQAEPERVNVTVTLDDGSVATRSIVAVSQVEPGAATLTLTAAEFGGHAIRAVTLTPDLSIPTVNPGTIIPPGSIEGSTRPYSEFVLRGVEFETTVATPPTRSVADGNVLTGVGGTDANATDGTADLLGADGGRVTGIGLNYNATAGGVGAPITGTYGSLTIAADGSYSYVLNNDLPAVQRLGANGTLIDRFTYTVTDGDGDRASTTLTISIRQPGASGARVVATQQSVAADDLSAARLAERGIEASGSNAALTAALVTASVVAAAPAHAGTLGPVADPETASLDPATHQATMHAATTATATTPVAATIDPVASTTPATAPADHHTVSAGTAAASVGTNDDTGAAAHGAPAADTAPAATDHVAAPLPAIAFVDTGAIPVAAVQPQPGIPVADAPTADAHVATVLADVLHGGAPAPAAGLDALLAALPAQPDATIDHGATSAFFGGGEPAMHDAMSSAWNALAAAQDAAMTSAGHDGIMVVAHAA